jgi:xylan 1,4-beta-xylosidase
MALMPQSRQRSTRTLCNPLDVAYRYQEIKDFDGRSVHREAADPSIVRYRDRYYLFASMSRGFWHSTDLSRWTFQATDKLPALDYAPDVREIDGALYICASRLTDSPFFRSENPLEDDFVEVGTGFPFWDPNLFQDDDGSVYFYWGASNKDPISGVRIDPAAWATIGDPVPLLRGEPEAHGWEQTGENHGKAEPRTERERLITEHSGGAPFIEGPWMTRHGTTYYLQYAAPGTEWNTYADGYYTASAPLGPFRYAPHSPFSAKPGGFITGAGHGCTFQDVHGNWWHASTMRISVNHMFERRIGLFPAGFDTDGVLFCNQNFGDYPMIVPDRHRDPWTESFAGWMLQSFRAGATASSSAPSHGPELAVNEDIRTWWTAGSTGPGEWLQLDLGHERTVNAVQINLADEQLALVAPERTDGADVLGSYRAIYPDVNATELVLELSTDGIEWHTVSDSRGTGTETPHAYMVIEGGERARFVRLTAGRMPFGGAFSVSGLRVFGTGDGAPPGRVTPHATRTDGRTARLEWEAEPAADGYNVRYGIAADKLYHSWLLYDQTNLDIRALNVDADYWVAIDSFNENGITPGETVHVDRGPNSLPA